MGWRTLLPWSPGPPPPPSRLIVGGVVVGAWGAYSQDGTWAVIGGCSLLAGLFELWRARRKGE